VSKYHVGSCVAWFDNVEEGGWMPKEQNAQFQAVELSSHIWEFAPDDKIWEKTNRAWERHLQKRCPILRGLNDLLRY